MNNIEWLDSLSLDELTAWMGAEHAELANGIGGGTNGIHDGITLPEGDAVAIMRRALDNQSSPTFCALARYLGISGGLSVSWAEAEGALRVLADMVERDYVSRVAYEDLRDEWKAKAESCNPCGWWNGNFQYCECDDGVKRSMTNLEWLWENDRDVLIKAILCNGYSCSECLRKYMKLEGSCSDAAREWLLSEHVDDCGHSADMSQKDGDCVREGGEMSEVDSRDNGWYLRYDGYMTPNSNHQRISGFKAARALDNRQNLVFVKFMGGKEADCRVYAPKLDVCENLHDSSKEKQKPRSREADSGNVSGSDGENLHVEKDTREKLEADVREFVARTLKRGDLTYGAITKMLDRQAAISEREAREQLDADWPKLLRCLESDYNIKASWDGLRKIWLTERAGGSATDAVREFAERYEQRIAELEDELHRSYDAESAKAEELTLRGVRIAELEAEVDMLTERKCPGYEPEGHYCRYHAQDFELNDSTVSRLKRENSKLEAERDGWRILCGELLDAAHAMQGVADAWDEEAGR